MVIGESGELADEPLHEVDADRCHVARRRGSKQHLPARRRTVERGNAQMREVRPERHLARPHGRGDELGGDHEGVPAVPVANEAGERGERGGTLAGTERGDEKGSVALIEPRSGALLVAVKDPSMQRRVHGSSPSRKRGRTWNSAYRS